MLTFFATVFTARGRLGGTLFCHVAWLLAVIAGHGGGIGAFKLAMTCWGLESVRTIVIKQTDPSSPQEKHLSSRGAPS